jgi:hypothetical protein
MFYSFTGRTHYEAKRLSERVDGELYEVWEQRRRTKLSAYLFGPGQARKKARIVIEPIAVSLEEYDKIYILCPIWGGWPAPAFNAIVRELPIGANVEIILTSDSGRAKDILAVRKQVELQGAHVLSLKVIKTEDLAKRDKRRRERMRREAQAKKAEAKKSET